MAENASVVVVGRNADHVQSAATELGDQARALVGDAIDPQTAVTAIEIAVDDFGRFDGLYHVAGGSGRKWGDGPLDEITDEGWQETLQLNLTSVFHSNRAAVRQFLDQETGGSILNMGSVLADSPSPHFFATHTYATSKAAIVGLTKSAAAYYADRDVRFNVIAPAFLFATTAATFLAAPIRVAGMSSWPMVLYIAVPSTCPSRSIEPSLRSAAAKRSARTEANQF